MNFAVGLCKSEARKFFYFYYYLDLLPVVSLKLTPHIYSKEGAEAFVKANGASLSNHTSDSCALGRLGDLGKFLLLLPNAWLTGTADKATAIPTTAFIFKLSLVFLLAAAFIQRAYVLGILLTVILGSYTPQLYEAYVRDSVLSLSITCCILLLAINFKFIGRRVAKPSPTDWVRAIISGVVLASIGAVRQDPLPMALSVFGLYLLSGQRAIRSVILCVTFGATLLVTRKGFEMYFHHKVDQAHEFVLNQGGTVFKGETLLYHPFWHAIAAGLGDFGRNKGFLWDDKTLFRLALPSINKKLGKLYSLQGYYFVEQGRPESEWIRPEAMPEYVDFIKATVLNTITTDPWWYIGILKQRVKRIRDYSDSFSLQWRSGALRLPVTIFVFLPTIAAYLITRRLDHIKLIAFSLPTCFIPVFVTSIQGAHNFSIIHLIVMAAGADATVIFLVWLSRLTRAFFARNPDVYKPITA